MYLTIQVMSIRIYFKNQTHLNYIIMIKLLVRWKL